MVLRGVRKNRASRRGNRRFRNRMSTRKQDFSGSLGRISRIPKISQSAPWNPLTVQRSVTISDATSFTLTVQYLIDVLRAQLSLPATLALTFRLLRIDVFDTNGRPFEMRIHDFTYDVSQVSGTLALVTAIAWPGRMQWSSARFVWPKAISAQPMSNLTPGTRLIASGAVGNPTGVESVGSGSMIIRFRFLWRPTPASSVPAFNQTLKASSNALVKDETDGLVDMGVPLPPSLDHDTVEPTLSTPRMESVSF